MNARAAPRRSDQVLARCLRSGVVLACWLALAAVARAGTPELFVQLAFHPENADVLALRYEFGGDGVIFSHDGGKRWQLMCATGIEPAISRGFSSGVTKTGQLLFAGMRSEGDAYPETLWQDDGHGCNFERVADLERTGVREIAADPSDGDVLYAVTRGFAAGTQNGLIRRDADGTWQRVGPQDEALSFEGLRLTKNGSGVRMYAAALRATGDRDAGTQAYGPVIRVSDDRGESWTERAFEPPTPRTSFELEAVDPLDPDTIVVSLRRPESMGAWMDSSDSVMISDDRGETFHSIFTLAAFGGAVFTPDGRLWIADAGSVTDPSAPQGLWVAENAHGEPKQVSEQRTTCLAYQPANDTLYACAARSLARVDQDDGSYEELMRAQNVSELAQCEGQHVAAACERQLCGAYCGAGHFAQAPLCAVYPGEYCGPAVAISEGTLPRDSVVRDAGAVDAAATTRDAGSDAATRDAGAPLDAGAPPPRVKPGCGCRTAVAGPTPYSGLWLLAALLLARRRCRGPQ